jgi:protein O-mannosyl-transferase
MKKNNRLRLLLVIVGVLLYIPSWFNGFVWDDEEQIVNNPFVKSFSYVGQVFSGSTFGGGGSALPSGGYYKPLMSVWYMGNHAVFGDWAGGYHLTQSVLHMVNGLLLFSIFLHLTQKRQTAFVAALIWMIHPGNVESVAYAASAQEVLASFFGLLSLWLVMHRRRLFNDEIVGLFAAAALILLALLSKEAGAVFPLVIAAYLIVVEKQVQMAKYFWIMLLPIILGYAVLRFGVAKIHIGPNLIIPVAQLSFSERMLTVAETLWHHIRVALMPVYLYIGHHQVITQFGLRTLWQLAVIGGLLGGMAWVNVRQKNKAGWFFWIWLILATGLVSNIYPLDMTYAERWSYMPIAALMGWGAVSIGRWKPEAGRWMRYGVYIIVVLLMGRNVMRQFDWKDGLTLYGSDVRFAQQSFDLENNYGVELMRAGRADEAKIHFERSMELSPYWWTPPNNLGVVYQRQGDLEKAKELYRLAISNGDYFLAYENLAAILVQEDDPEAVVVVEAGLARFPYNRNLLEMAFYLSSK